MKITTLLSLILTMHLYSISLKEVYDQAGPNGIYDKYLQLENGVTYSGGLLIGTIHNFDGNQFEENLDANVAIIGNGAVLDLGGEQISISYCNNILDISDCVIINGNIRYRGKGDEKGSKTELIPKGSVINVTFYKPHDYAVRLQGAGTDVILSKNIVVDPICTGDDFKFTGSPSPYNPTGEAFALSILEDVYGFADVNNNWTYFTDRVLNNQLFNHFALVPE
ncbi:MAG: hypothetical protein JXR48_02115 [Candidatus Delongbacteria bacterium]|nr:hypothetical protein [Candidatus Delongbacteria bacterium]MBN2833741.1 hypothetical protein [Candidatus Delongbacteria bacterium]